MRIGRYICISASDSTKHAKHLMLFKGNTKLFVMRLATNKYMDNFLIPRYKSAMIRKRRNQKEIPTLKTEVGKN